MTFAAIAEGLGGIVLVGVVLSDIFRSVILPRATQRTLRLGPLLGVGLLRGWLSWARHRPAHRHAMLGALGPLLIVLEMLIWVTLMILGYGMMIHALRSGMTPTPSFDDALYAAGSIFLTTGLNGQEAVSGPVRFISVVSALSGLAVVTLVVTFLLSVQGALQRREVLVLRLRARTGPRPSGIGVLLAHARLGPESDPALLEFFHEWEAWAADVLISHRAYPILVYFRSTDEDCEWLAALGAVLDAAALIAVMRHEGAAEHALLCHAMGTRLAAEVALQFGLMAPPTPGLPKQAFLDAFTRLGEADYPVGKDDETSREEAWTRFLALRTAYLPPLLALTDRFGVQEAAWEPDAGKKP